MGNYQEYLKSAVAPLRDIDDTNAKMVAPMFGNPFARKVALSLSVFVWDGTFCSRVGVLEFQKPKLGSAGMGNMVEEADVDALGLADDSTSNNPRLKRSASEPRTAVSNQNSTSSSASSSQHTSHKRSRSTSPGSRSPVKHHPPRVTLEQQLAAPLSSSSTAPSSSVKRRLNVDPFETGSEIKKEEPTAPVISPLVNGVSSTSPAVNGEDVEKTDDKKMEEQVEDLVADDNVMQRLRTRALRAIKTPGRSE